jgi:hypothetical protein
MPRIALQRLLRTPRSTGYRTKMRNDRTIKSYKSRSNTSMFSSLGFTTADDPLSAVTLLQPPSFLSSSLRNRGVLVGYGGES